jgi:hypothetical protein
MPGWSRVLFPGHGVPPFMIHPSAGTFIALATSALIRTLNSSYSLCSTKRDQQRCSLFCSAATSGRCGDAASVYLHGAAFLDERRLHLVLEVVDLEREVELGGTGLDVELLAERHPLARELGSLTAPRRSASTRRRRRRSRRPCPSGSPRPGWRAPCSPSPAAAP